MVLQLLTKFYLTAFDFVIVICKSLKFFLLFYGIVCLWLLSDIVQSSIRDNIPTSLLQSIFDNVEVHWKQSWGSTG